MFEMQNIHIEKFDYDHREYKYIEIENGVKILLISDPKAHISAANINFLAGYLDDHKGQKGTAKFIGKLIEEKFQKLKRAPNSGKELEFKVLTKAENSEIILEMEDIYLNQTIKEIIQIISSLTLDFQEIESVIGMIKKDFRRQYFDENDFLKYMVGRIFEEDSNLRTLDLDDLMRLEKSLSIQKNSLDRGNFEEFFENCFLTTQTTATLYANRSILELEYLARSTFSKLKTKRAEPKITDLSSEILKLELPKAMAFNPLKFEDKLNLIFWKSKLLPHSNFESLLYLSNLILTEQKGGLKFLLKKKGWLIDLHMNKDTITAFDAQLYYDFEFELTHEGTNHFEDIIAYFFFYLNFISEKGLSEERYRNVSIASNLRFSQDLSQYKFLNLLGKFSQSIRFHSVKDLVRGIADMDSFDMAKIKIFLQEELSLKNLLVLIRSQDFSFKKYYGNKDEEKKHEQMYNQTFKMRKLDVAQILNSKKDFSLNFQLPRNDFILAEKFDLHYTQFDYFHEDDSLSLIFSNTSYEIFFSQAVINSLPIANIIIDFYASRACENLRDKVMFLLIYSALDLKFANKMQEIKSSGFEISFEEKDFYFSINIYGFSDKILDALSSLLKDAFNSRISALDFLIIKEKAITKYSNKNRMPLSNFIYNSMQTLLFHCYKDANSILRELDVMTFEKFLPIYSEKIKEFYVKVLAVGNIRKSSLISNLQEILESFQGKKPYENSWITGNPESAYYREMSPFGKNKEQIMMNFFSKDHLKRRFLASMIIISELLEKFSRDFYKERNYDDVDISLISDDSSDRNSLFVFILSQNHNPSVLNEKFEEISIQFESFLKNFTEEEFKMHKNRFFTKFISRRSDVREIANAWVNEMRLETYRFTFDIGVFREMKIINPRDLVLHYQILMKDGFKFSYQIYSQEHTDFNSDSYLTKNQTYSQREEKKLEKIEEILILV